MSRVCTPVFVGVTPPVSELWLPFKNDQISLSGHGYSPWSWKNLIYQNRLKKFMQVGIDVKCMYTYFGGRGLFSCGDSVTLNLTKFLFRLIIDSIRIGSKYSCKQMFAIVFFPLYLSLVGGAQI